MFSNDVDASLETNFSFFQNQNDFIINQTYQRQEFLTNVSLSESELAESIWGPKHDPFYILIPLTCVYVLIFIAGVVGNISTCIVISRNKFMHTTTNYYLFSLAISDLLLLTSGLPPELYSMWSRYPYIFGEVYCTLQGVASETSANATVLTITAFTVERYVAICHPFMAHTLSKLNRAVKLIIGIWTLAICLAIPQALAFGIVYGELENGTKILEASFCGVKHYQIPHVFAISTCLFFVTPMSLIIVLYILIGIQLRESANNTSKASNRHRIYKPMVTYAKSSSTKSVLMIEDNDDKSMISLEKARKSSSNKNMQNTRHVIRMLVAVVVCFFICWAPFHSQRLLATYGEQSSPLTVLVFEILTRTSGVLYFMSTAVNPLLYSIMSHKFRDAFKRTYHRCCCNDMNSTPSRAGRYFKRATFESSSFSCKTEYVLEKTEPPTNRNQKNFPLM